MYLYLGDDAGFIKIWDMIPTLKKIGVGKVKSFISQKTGQYNPYRMERVDCSDMANAMRQERKKKGINLPPPQEP